MVKILALQAPSSEIPRHAGLPLRVGFNVQRGYHAQIYGKKGTAMTRLKDLPKDFLNPQEGKNTISFTTEEIIQVSSSP